MSAIIADIEAATMKAAPVPRFRPGDTVKVHVRIKEEIGRAHV